MSINCSKFKGIKISDFLDILSLPIYDASMFFGRKYELSIIKDAIASKRAELGIVYGRRRIGKSSLLMKALKKPWSYHAHQMDQ